MKHVATKTNKYAVIAKNKKKRRKIKDLVLYYLTCFYSNSRKLSRQVLSNS